MGGRKQKKKQVLDRIVKEASVTSNRSALARNLRKTDLGAVIFGCTHNTINECLSSQLFGLPEGHFSYIKNISQGLVLFLFSYSDRKLYGIFEAAGQGQMYIDEYAWVGDADHTTMYPAQVRVRVGQECQPLSENQFKPIIANNYFESKHFYFELDHDQTKKLISLFMSKPVKSSASSSQIQTRWNNINDSLPSIPKSLDYSATQDWQAEAGFDHAEQFTEKGSSWDGGMEALPQNPNQPSKLSYASALGQSSTTTTTASSSLPPLKWSALFKTQSTNDGQCGTQASNVYEDEADLPQANTWEESQPFATTTDEVTRVHTGDDDWHPQENTWEESQPFATITDEITHVQTWEDGWSHQENAWGESNLDDNTTKEADWGQTLVSDPNHQANTTTNNADFLHEDPWDESQPNATYEVDHVQTSVSNGQHFDESPSLPRPLDDNPACQLSASAKTNESNEEENESDEEENGSHDEEDESDEEENDEKDSYVVPNTVSEQETFTDLESLVHKLMQEVQGLKGSQMKQIVKNNMLENELVKSKEEIQQLKNRLGSLESGSQSTSISVDSVYIVGGFDGSSWLSTLESYFPSRDTKYSLTPVNVVKPYASAATLNGELYHIGGEGSQTVVESFNPTMKQWISRPPLFRKNIRVTGASIKDRLFVVGGVNGSHCSSEVEYLDLNLGNWVPTCSMQSKRLFPAAAELNNVLYVTGGFDGSSYSSSVERFDPREAAWHTLPNMNTKKGCHSMVVLNEKLYTLGGFDGDKYVATVESFDTRMNSWLEAEPMNFSRGCFGAFILGEKLYAIGGVTGKTELLEEKTVECYKEGSGWEIVDLKAIGKRSNFSAIVM